MLFKLNPLFSFKSYSARLYTGMLVLVFVLAVTVSFSQGEMVYQALLNAREKELATVAEHLAGELPTHYEEFLNGKGADTGAKDSYAERLKNKLEKHMPTRSDVGIGYYDKSIDRVITAGPDLFGSFLKELPLGTSYFNIKETGQVEIVKNPASFGWWEKPIMGVMSPVKKDGKIVGQAWANMKTEKIIAAAAQARRELLFATMIIFLVGLLGVHFISSRSKKTLREFAECMKNIHSDNGLTCSIDELAPLVEEVKDIHRRQLDLALQNERLATIAQLAAGLAHDIRNPLTSIRGFLQLISSRVANNDRQLINISIEELDGINRLVQDMLFLSRPPQSNFVKGNLGDLLTNIKDFVTPEANLKEILLKSRIQPNLPEVLMDSGQMRQVFINLIRNSFEAIKSKGEILLSAYCTGNDIFVEIKDNGIGIPEAEQEKIFDALYTTKNNGTGLGLAICREIIASHKGSISIKSKVGIGTTFIIRIPVENPGLVNGVA